MKLIETYKEKIDELIGYTSTGEFVATQTRQLRVLQNLTSDALD